MPIITRNTITIKRDIEDVFSYVVNMENYKKWFPGVLEVKPENNHIAHGVVRKKYIETINIPFKGKETVTITVKEVVKNSKFMTEADLEGFLPRMTIEFTESGAGGTEVTYQMESRNNSAVFKVMLFLFIRNQMKKNAKIGLEKLKQNLENHS